MLGKLLTEQLFTEELVTLGLLTGELAAGELAAGELGAVTSVGVAATIGCLLTPEGGADVCDEGPVLPDCILYRTNCCWAVRSSINRTTYQGRGP